MTVDEMLDRMSMEEFANWIAFYSKNESSKQTTAEIREALEISLKASRKAKRNAISKA